MAWWELDLTYVGIRILSALGIVHSVKLPPAPPLGPTGSAERPGELGT
jgi:fatty-acid desaturase